MRINVYAEEITANKALTVKRVKGKGGDTHLMYGVRLFLKSPVELHDGPEDDDRSAVTYWFNTEEHARGYFMRLAHSVANEIWRV